MTRIIVHGGGFAGIYAVMQLRRAIASPSVFIVNARSPAAIPAAAIKPERHLHAVS
jgi:hypothetical protein